MWIPSEAVNIIFIFKITYSNYLLSTAHRCGVLVCSDWSSATERQL